MSIFTSLILNLRFRYSLFVGLLMVSQVALNLANAQEIGSGNSAADNLVVENQTWDQLTAYVNAPSGNGGNTSCGLPVCNAQALLAEFRRLNTQERDRYIRGLRPVFAATRRLNSAAEMTAQDNLSGFLERLAALIEEIHEVPWLLSAVRQLRQEVIYQMAVDTPLSADQLLTYFRRLSNEGQRLSVLQAWQSRIAGIEDSPQLQQLARFFEEAKIHSVAQDDEEYVQNIATMAEAAIGSKIRELDPYYEGVFTLTIAASAANEQQNSNGLSNAQTGAARILAAIDKMVVIDTLGLEGLQVALINSRIGRQIFVFNNVVMQGDNIFVANSVSPLVGRAELRIVMNASTRQAQVSIVTAEARELRWTGQGEQSYGMSYSQLFRLQDHLAQRPQLSQDIFQWQFAGFYGPLSSVMNMVYFDRELSRGGPVLGGTLNFPRVANLNVRFSQGRFYARRGLISLVGPAPGGGLIKIVFAVGGLDDQNRWSTRDGQPSVVLRGLGMSTLNGRQFPLNFRVQPVSEESVEAQK